ncbi:MAG: response regulator transcription factor [Opitutales bacterium]|nr:response regulator transcription factor [Opitutales bacterium]
MRLRIVIAEDQVMLREVIRKVCLKAGGCTVVGEAGTGKMAKRVIADTQPDLVLLDLHMPEGDGFEVAAFARSRWPAIKILLMSAHCDDYTLYLVERAGVQGFVDKNTESVKTLGKAIRALRRGRKYFSPAYHEAAEARATDPRNFAQLLSKREYAVLSLIGQSLSDKAIARQLKISPATAQTHRSHIMGKLGATNSLELMQYAIQHGFTRVVTLRNGKSVYS